MYQTVYVLFTGVMPSRAILTLATKRKLFGTFIFFFKYKLLFSFVKTDKQIKTNKNSFPCREAECPHKAKTDRYSYAYGGIWSPPR